MTQLPTDMSQLTPEQRQQMEEKLKNMSPEELAELQQQQCIFCQIISEKIPSKKIYEDDLCLAVLDVNPAAKGHLLLLTKEHYAIMPQISDPLLSHLFLVSKRLSQLLLKVLKVDGVNISIANGPAAGQRAQHFMIHLIPRKTGDKILDLEENLIDQEMISKVKSAVEEKLKELIGAVKKDKGVKNKSEKEKSVKFLAEPPRKVFVTSAAAKRYHQENCAFAQNIPFEKKIILTPEEMEQGDKLPCTCVSGKKIPLKKKGTSKKVKKSIQKKKIEKEKGIEKKEVKKEIQPETKIVGKKAKKITKPIKKKVSKKKTVDKPRKKEEEASLDDIAKLFG